MNINSDHKHLEINFGELSPEDTIDLILDMKNTNAIDQDLCDELLRVFNNSRTPYTLEEYEAVVNLSARLHDAMRQYMAIKHNKPKTLGEYLSERQRRPRL